MGLGDGRDHRHAHRHLGRTALLPGVNRVLGTSGIRILTRVMGLLLAAIAVQIMADGVFAFLAIRL